MHRMPGLIALTGILIGSAPLWAETVTERTETAAGITWTYTVNADDGGVTLTGANPASGQLTIPDTLGGLPVTGIGASAFYTNTTITSVDFPQSITKIGDNSFYGCSGLTDVTLPQHLQSIGQYAFLGCNSLRSVYLPPNLTTISGGAFRESPNLTDITFPEKLEVIGKSAFLKTGITELRLPGTVTTIGATAFQGCEQLKSVYIPASVKSISYSAFQDCVALTDLTFAPDSQLSETSTLTFYGCKALTQVVLPDSLSVLKAGTFRGCTKLATIVLPKNLTEIIVQDANGDITQPFFGCSNLKTVVFRSSQPPTYNSQKITDLFHDSNNAGQSVTCYYVALPEEQATNKWGEEWAGKPTVRISAPDWLSGEEILALSRTHCEAQEKIPLVIKSPKPASVSHQPITEVAGLCFSGIVEQSASSSAVTVTVTPYAFGISGIRAEANGDVIVTAEVTGISGVADRDGAVKFADGTDVVAVYHTTGADGRSLRQEAGRTRVDGGLSVKDRVEINLAGFLAAGGLGAGEGTHRLTVYATKPIGNTAASGE